jgi:hypothetical protein
MAEGAAGGLSARAARYSWRRFLGERPDFDRPVTLMMFGAGQTVQQHVLGDGVHILGCHPPPPLPGAQSQGRADQTDSAHLMIEVSALAGGTVRVKDSSARGTWVCVNSGGGQSVYRRLAPGVFSTGLLGSVLTLGHSGVRYVLVSTPSSIAMDGRMLDFNLIGQGHLYYTHLWLYGKVLAYLRQWMEALQSSMPEPDTEVHAANQLEQGAELNMPPPSYYEDENEPSDEPGSAASQPQQQ